MKFSWEISSGDSSSRKPKKRGRREEERSRFKIDCRNMWREKKELKEKLGRRDSRRHLFLLPAPFVKSTIHPGHYRETFDLKVRAARLTPSASVNRRHNRYVAQSFETGCVSPVKKNSSDTLQANVIRNRLLLQSVFHVEFSRNLSARITCMSTTMQPSCWYKNKSKKKNNIFSYLFLFLNLVSKIQFSRRTFRF